MNTTVRTHSYAVPRKIPSRLVVSVVALLALAVCTLPSWYAISGAHRMIDPALQRAMAQRIGATTTEFPDASHAGGYTHYAARFVELIEQAGESSDS